MVLTRNNPLISETTIMFESGLEGGESASVISFTNLLNGVFDEEGEEDEKTSRVTIGCHGPLTAFPMIWCCSSSVRRSDRDTSTASRPFQQRRSAFGGSYRLHGRCAFPRTGGRNGPDVSR